MSLSFSNQISITLKVYIDVFKVQISLKAQHFPLPLFQMPKVLHSINQSFHSFSKFKLVTYSHRIDKVS